MKKTIFNFLLYKKDVVYLNSSSSIKESIEFLKEQHYTAVPVLHADGTYAGSVSEGDFLWALVNQGEKVLSQPVSSIIRKDYLRCCTIETSMEEIAQSLLDQNYVPIIDDRKIFIGIVTRKAILTGLL